MIFTSPGSTTFKGLPLIKMKKANNVRSLGGSKTIFLSVVFLFVLVICGGGTAPLSPPVVQKTSSVEKKKAKSVQVPEKAEKKMPEKKKQVEFA